MVSPEPLSTLDACLLEGVQPLLSELRESIYADTIDPAHADRARAEAFVHAVFAARYRANVQSFYPTLLSFSDERRLRAIVGFREASGQPLFAEQYLDKPAQQLIGEQFDVEVHRNELVEVGNLALDNPGDARWAIAATTEFLHALGYRWVLFTATRVLVNTFQRLGMRPIALASAQASMLGDQAGQWGNYYRAAPIVCAGRIASGHRKLHRRAGHPQPMLEELLAEVTRLATHWHRLSASRGGER